MKKLEAEMFNKRASDPKSKPDQILEALALKPGQNIADIGAGGGYFSFRFAAAVGRGGKVYALDTKPEFLEFIKNSALKKGLNNIETILAKEDDLPLPEKTLDIVFIRNVYHHLKNRPEYFRKLSTKLKPKARVAIIDYKGSGFFSFRRIFGHYTPKGIIVEEMKKAGYRLMKEHDILPEQYFLVFSGG